MSRGAARLVVFLCPIAIGLWFWTDSGGHFDNYWYRDYVRTLCRDGYLPTARLEWSHLGHNLMVAPVYAVARALGLTDDPFRCISAINFVAAGWLAATVFRTQLVLRPEAGAAGAAFAGIAVATCPGWLLQSQQAMTDVVGHALVAIVALRQVQHGVRARDANHRAGLWPHVLDGVLLGQAVLIRVSSALFVPLVAWLAWRVVRARGGWRTAAGRRVPIGMVLGGSAVVCAVLGFQVASHGWREFARGYFVFGEDNSPSLERVARLPQTLGAWGQRLWAGVGPVGLVLGGVGIVATLHGARWALPVLALLVPYYWVVAMNILPEDFRFQLPTMALFALAAGWWAGPLRRLGPGLALPCIVALGAANVAHAWPLLELMRTREAYRDFGAQRLVETAPEDALLLGGDSAVALTYFRRARMTVLAVGERSRDAEWDILHNEARHRRSLWCISDGALDGLRRELVSQGYRERVVAEWPGDGLRSRNDPNLFEMREPLFVECGPLRVYELRPPPVVPPPSVTLTLAQTASGGLRFRIAAPGRGGLPCRVLVGRRGAGLVLGNLRLPFAPTDPLVTLLMDARAVAAGDLRGFHGELDAAGRHEATAPAHLVERAEDLIAVAVLFDSATDVRTARAASAPVRCEPR